MPEVTVLLNEYLKQFPLRLHFDEADVTHWLLPHAGVIDSWVVEDPETKKITDFCSFYHLPSSILGHPTHKNLNAAYSYYNVTTKTNLTQLMNDLLINAKKIGVDVVNCLDLMHNSTFLEQLKFGPGDGFLHYYLYNWKCPYMKNGEVAIVLL